MGEGKPTTNRELLVLERDVSAELSEDLVSLDVEFHDHEDLIYERSAGQLSSHSFCSELLNFPPRGGEFLHE